MALRDKLFRLTPTFLNHIQSRFDDIERFKFFTLNAIKNEKKEIEDRFKKETMNLSEEQERLISEFYAEDYFMVEKDFTQISLRSFVVIFFSYIEDGLNTICGTVHRDKQRYRRKYNMGDFVVEHKDIRGKGIEKAKLYLEKICGCNLHTGEKPWSEIQTIRKIRNSIVHEDTYANENLREQDSNFRLHTEEGRLKLENNGMIIIKPAYLDYILPIVKDFFKEIEVNIE